MRAALLSVVLLGHVATVGGLFADSQDQLLKRCAEVLADATTLTGDFRQEKHADFLDAPLVSSGKFSIYHPSGLTWHVAEPIESVMEVQGTKVTLDGERVHGFGMGRMMSMLMGGLIHGDFGSVVRHFNVTGEAGENHWELTLHARSNRMKSAIEKIELGGGRYMQFLHIYENDGNRTLIWFEDVRPVESHVQSGP